MRINDNTRNTNRTDPTVLYIRNDKRSKAASAGVSFTTREPQQSGAIDNRAGVRREYGRTQGGDPRR